MCDPVSITIALAAGTAAISGAGQVMAFQGQKAAYAANKQAANFNYGQREEAISAQNAQLGAQHSEDVFSNAIDFAKSQGHIAASASDLGLGAQSTTQQENVGSFESGRVRSIEDLNYLNQRLQLGRDSTGAAIARQSQINSVSKPSGLALALGLAGTAVTAAGKIANAAGGPSGGAGASAMAG